MVWTESQVLSDVPLEECSAFKISTQDNILEDLNLHKECC
jgi:hypothetical protein